MLNNYKYPHYYPQPDLLTNDYRPANDRFELDLPLPGYSVKVPFEEKPTRFLTVNRRKREIDYLRDHIQHKVDMEEMHYQAKIQQMRRENQYNRQRLERLINQQPKNLFQVPDKYTDEARSVSSNLENISLKRLQNQKQRHLMDSIDKVKMSDTRKHSQSYQQGHLSDSEEDEQKKAEEKEQRQRELDYIYKKKGAINTEEHFGTMPVIQKEVEKKKEKEKEKREEYEWIQKVRKAKATKFIADDHSVDSSRASDSSEEKKKKQKQKQQEQRLKQQKLKKQQQARSIKAQSNKAPSNKAPSLQQSRANQKQPITQRQRLKTPQKISQRTPSREQDISNMSQFSRYANKNDIFNKDKPKKQLQNIFEVNQDVQPVTQRRDDRRSWKM